MYSLPQEIEVWYIIPAIRKEFSKIFVNKHKLTLDKAGEILGISKAAVSQYLSNKRANKFKLPELIKKEVATSAEIIMKDNKKAIKETERILKIIRDRKCTCEACKKYNPKVFDFCECGDCR